MDVSNTATRFIKFAIVSGIGMVVNLSVLYLLTDIFNVFYLLSESVAFVMAATNNFLLNNRWSFRQWHKGNNKIKYMKFMAIASLCLVLNLSALYALTDLVGIYYMYSQVIASILVLLTSFTLNSLWTFRQI
ncbi:MAG: GtrA family protein [Nanobdellota archaeon]